MSLTKEDIEKAFSSMVSEKVNSLRESLRQEMAAQTKSQSQLLAEAAVIVDERHGTVSVKAGEKRGLAAAQFIRVQAAASAMSRTPAQVAKEWGYTAVTKALEAQDAAKGGLLVPEPVMQEVIELLRAAVVVEASGAVIMPMPNGNLSMNYHETSSTALYIGERGVITPSNPTFGRLKLTAKKLAALVPISNDLVRYASPMVDEIVRNDLIATLSVRKDQAFIRDDGTSDKPKGLRWLAPGANINDRSLSGGNVTLETVTADLASMANILEGANIKMLRPGWLFSPRTKWFLMRLRDGNGNLVFKDDMDAGSLFGFPYRTTTNIPNTLGAAGDESEIYLVDFSSIIVGETMNLQIDVSNSASFVQNGSQVNGFQTDDTLIRAIMEHDIGARQRGAEIAILTAVDWY